MTRPFVIIASVAAFLLIGFVLLVAGGFTGYIIYRHYHTPIIATNNDTPSSDDQPIVDRPVYHPTAPIAIDTPDTNLPSEDLTPHLTNLLPTLPANTDENLPSAPDSPSAMGTTPSPLTNHQLLLAANAIPLNFLRFPDGSGSIGLPIGWTTTAQSSNGPFGITGPSNEQLTLGLTLPVSTPNSPTAQQARQNPSAQSILVAPFTDPVAAFKAIIPQLSAGSPDATLTLDDISVVQEFDTHNPNAKAELLTYGTTSTQNGHTTHLRSLTEVIVTRLSNDAWTLTFTEAAATEATYQQDLPTMVAIVNSWKPTSPDMQQKIDPWLVAPATAQRPTQTVQSASDEYYGSQPLAPNQRTYQQ